MLFPPQELSPRQRKAKKLSTIALLFMVLGSLGLDQVSKIVAERQLMVWADQEDLRQYQGRRYPVWAVGEYSAPREQPHFYLSFNFNYVRNQGAAWGALSDWDDRFRIPFFYGVTLLAVIIIGLYLKSTPLSHRLARFALALILSGALGNFVDRLQRGYVIDFIDVRWVIPLPFTLQMKVDSFPGFLSFLNFAVDAKAWRYNFPNFNWADSAISVGVAFLLFDMLILETLRKRALATDTPKQEAKEVRAELT